MLKTHQLIEDLMHLNHIIGERRDRVLFTRAIDGELEDMDHS
jgi:hypothetical protein